MGLSVLETGNFSTMRNINSDAIDLECASGAFKHENYCNKGNFESPMPENYYYRGPKPDRVHHTEQKIVEYLRQKYQGNPNVSGQIEIISERKYCENGRVLVDLFEKEFPNSKVIRVGINK